jgi:hypothetical protein
MARRRRARLQDERRMAWWTANGFMTKTWPLWPIVGTPFVEEAVKVLDR